MDFLSSIPYPAQTPIYDSLNTKDFTALKLMSTGLAEQIQSYELSHFGQHQLYSSFFPTYTEQIHFRQVQAHTRALVSGSAVVSLLSRKKFPVADLDVFVPADGAGILGSFFLSLGFVFEPLKTVVNGNRKESVQQDDDFFKAFESETLKWSPNTGSVADRYEATTIAGVFNFRNSMGNVIQLVATKVEAIEVILGFHSTLVMNIATAHEVISLYPNMSFIQFKSLYLLDTSQQKVAEAKMKYEQRGWETTTMISAVDALNPNSEISLKTRWIGDKHCWIIKMIPIEGVLPTCYDNFKVTSWCLSYPLEDGARVIRNRMKSTWLNSQYVITWEAERAAMQHPCFCILQEVAQAELDTVLLKRTNETNERLSIDNFNISRPHGCQSPAPITNKSGYSTPDHHNNSENSHETNHSTTQEEIEPVSASGLYTTQTTKSQCGEPDPIDRETVNQDVTCDGLSSQSDTDEEYVQSPYDEWKWKKWGYCSDTNNCTHTQGFSEGPGDLDKPVTEFLRGLYPLIDNTNKHSQTRTYLRTRFQQAAEDFANSPGAVQPTGYIASLIMEILNDIDRVCDLDDVTLDLSFEYEPATTHLWSVLVIQVPAGEVGYIREGLPAWIVDELDDAHVALTVE